jgi:hypothetical protein
MSIVTETVLQTTEAMLPAILIAAGVANPALANAAQIAPAVINVLNMATAMQKAGYMTPDQLAMLFHDIGTQIKDSHEKWAAMNLADQSKPSTLAPQAG